MGGSTKKTTKSSQSQTSKATPYAAITPGLNQLGTNIGTAMDSVQALPQYTGDFVAGPGQLQQAVIPALQNSAALAGSLVDPAKAAMNQSLSQLPQFGGPSLAQGTQGFGSYDASSVQPVIEAAMAPYLRQLTEQILPGMQSAGIESGAYSNDRAMAVMPQAALRDTSRMMSEVGAGIAHNDFLQQQNRLQNAYQMDTQRGLGEADVLTQRLAQYPELMDNVMRMSTGQADLTTQAAGYDTAMRQAEINNALAQDQYNINAPFRGLDQAANLYGAFAPYATQSMTGKSKTTEKTSQPLGAQVLQGAMGIGSMVAGFPGAGTALSGMLGLGGAAAANPMMGLMGGSASQMFRQPIPQFGVPGIGGW